MNTPRRTVGGGKLTGRRPYTGKGRTGHGLGYHGHPNGATTPATGRGYHGHPPPRDIHHTGGHSPRAPRPPRPAGPTRSSGGSPPRRG